MKKAVIFMLFLSIFFSIAAVSSFARSIPGDFLFIEGTAEPEDHKELLLSIFSIEANGAGFSVTENREDAAYTFRFFVVYNHCYHIDNNRYILEINLIDNATNVKILSFDFFYSDFWEIYNYSQFLFHRATMYIPVIQTAELDRRWQNKWLYFRISLDYPISFYRLQPNGLHVGGQAVFGSPNTYVPLDHIILPQPGLTAGIELQFLRFMSLEFNFQMSFGDPNTYRFINLAAGAQVKFNIKTAYFKFQPYGAFLYPINISPEFSQIPRFALGAGIQIGVRGGAIGALFLDINFLYHTGTVLRFNPYASYAPDPPLIHYRHFVFGISVGYKLGVFNRRR